MTDGAEQSADRQPGSMPGKEKVAQTIWVRVAPHHVPLLVKACDEMNMSRPELMSRLLRFYLDHPDFWGLILGLGNPRIRNIEAALLAKKLQPQVQAELEALRDELLGGPAADGK